MIQLMRFPSAVKTDPAIEAWFAMPDAGLRWFARPWFDHMRALGPDVRELMHDSHPTACVGDAAFAYVNAFRTHINVGFFNGAVLPDPAGLLEGTGKRMRHVKLLWGQEADAVALGALITASYQDMRSRAGLAESTMT